MQNIRNELVEFEDGNHVLINQYETKTSWGYKPMLGTIWEPLDKVAIGLSLSKTYVTSTDYEKQVVTRNSSDSTNFPNTEDISIDTSTSSDKDKFPLTTSLGVAYFATPRLLLSGDLRYHEKVSDKESTYNLALGTEYYFTDSLAVRAGLFTDRANTPELKSGGVNQREHINIYGGSLSLSLFHRMSSITLGMSYAYGKGNAQVQLESDAIQTAEITNLTVYIAASYRY